MDPDMSLSLIRGADPTISFPASSRSLVRDHRPSSLCPTSLSPELFLNTTVSMQADTISPVEIFSDLAGFTVDPTAVFDYPPPCDSILTPNSGSLSPPMPTVGDKMMHGQTYHHHHHGGPANQQQPTPPNSSKSFWHSNFDLHAAAAAAAVTVASSSSSTSQSSPSLGAPAPISAAVSTAAFDPAMTTYMAHSSLDNNMTTATSASPYYTGPYGVPTKSDLDSKTYYHQPQTHTTSHGGAPGPSGYSQYPTIASSMSLMVPHPHQQQSSHTLSPTPLSQPAPIAPSMSHSHSHSFTLPSSTHSPPLEISPSLRSRPPHHRIAKPLRAPASTARRAANARPKNTTQKVPLAPRDIHPLQFKPGVPDRERAVLELRREYDGNKGKNMWDLIGATYKKYQEYEASKPENQGKKEYLKEPSKATLQMRVTRARSRWIEWPQHEVDLLHQAWVQIEKDRYKLIRAKFEELGGGSYMAWNDRNIECKLIEDGLENIYYHEEARELIRARFKPEAAHKQWNAYPLVPGVKSRSFNPMTQVYRENLGDTEAEAAGGPVSRGMGEMPEVGIDSIMSDIEAVRGEEMWEDCDIEVGMQ